MQRRHFLSTGLLAGLSMAGLPETFAQLATNDKPRCITNKVKRRPKKPFYVPPTEGPPWAAGERIRPVPRISFGDTGAQFSVAEITIAPKIMGPAPHFHKELDEYMRVVKGTVTVMVGDELFDVKEGGWHLRPHGVVHTFWNAGEEPATFIDVYPNQNFDLFVEEMLKMYAEMRQKGFGPAAKETLHRLDELHEEWGIVMYHDRREALRVKHGLT